MTVRFFVHTKSKRAEALTLVDSGATKNFMNLDYARYLRLPIQCLATPRKLYNVDGISNQSSDLLYYTDLSVQTGSKRINLQFFLSNLGENKAILGYPWFAAMQPQIDWRRGWIDHSQLPIIFRTLDAAKPASSQERPTSPESPPYSESDDYTSVPQIPLPKSHNNIEHSKESSLKKHPTNFHHRDHGIMRSISNLEPQQHSQAN